MIRRVIVVLSLATLAACTNGPSETTSTQSTSSAPTDVSGVVEDHLARNDFVPTAWTRGNVTVEMDTNKEPRNIKIVYPEGVVDCSPELAAASTNLVVFADNLNKMTYEEAYQLCTR